MKTSALGLLVLACSVFPQIGAAHERAQFSTASLTVSVFNDAGVEPAVWSQAQRRATEIMQSSGMSLAWLDCGSLASRPDSNCSAISYPAHFSVRLVPKVSPVKGHIFGQTFQDAAGEGNYVLVYYASIKAFRPATTISTGELLGCVVAHELGHLLLGNDSHSATGLMSAVWQEPELRLAARGKLLFSGDEGERMRSRYMAATARLRRQSISRHSSVGK